MVLMYQRYVSVKRVTNDMWLTAAKKNNTEIQIKNMSNKDSNHGFMISGTENRTNKLRKCVL
jgi:hypothetical protein